MVLIDVSVATADGAEDLAARLTHRAAAVDGQVVDEGALVGVGRRAVWAAEGRLQTRRASTDARRARHQQLGAEYVRLWNGEIW